MDQKYTCVFLHLLQSGRASQLSGGIEEGTAKDTHRVLAISM